VTLVAIVSSPLGGCADKLVMISQKDLCEKGWKHQTVSKDDKLTQKTAATADGNNRSRPLWGCQYGRNEAIQ